MAISFGVTDLPQDVTRDLDAGVWVAQARGGRASCPAVLYATAAAPPASDRAYFAASNGDFFTFRKGAGISPTWVKAPFEYPDAMAFTDPCFILAISPATGALPREAAPRAPSTADITAARLAAELGIDETRAGTLLEMALARAGQYAPTAPAAVSNEAVIRFAGYMNEANFGALRDENVGPLSATYQSSHANAWRNSGAAALLSPWRVRRAGRIAG